MPVGVGQAFRLRGVVDHEGAAERDSQGLRKVGEANSVRQAPRPVVPHLMGEVGAVVRQPIHSDVAAVKPQVLEEHPDRTVCHGIRVRFRAQCVAQPQQKRLPLLALVQRRLGVLAIGDVVEDDRDEAAVLVNTGEIHVEPASDVLLVVFDPKRLASPCDLPVAIQPDVLDARQHLRHRAAHDVVGATLTLVGGVHLAEDHVDDLAMTVVDHLDDRQPLVDRVEGRPVVVLALALRRLGAGAFDGGPGALGDFHQQRLHVA